MKIENTEFYRLFSLNMYKNRQLLLGKMSFSKDFVSDTRGNLYPLIKKNKESEEKVWNNTYVLKSGAIERMFARFFPFASYEVSFLSENLSGSCSLAERGTCGFAFYIPGASVLILCDGHKVVFREGKQKKEISLENCRRNQGSEEKEQNRQIKTMIVTCRPGAFDVYFQKNGCAQFAGTFQAESFSESNQQQIFQKGYVCLAANGNVTVMNASSYIDCGISQADIKAIRYEDGTVMTEQGKIYLTASVRMEEKAYQGIFSWIPGTAEFELCGTLFFDAGDGCWQGDVASSVLYHREKKEWYLWMAAFSQGHVLGHAIFEGDPRFGVNVVDIAVMERAGEQNSIKEFLGFSGDEDPDFFYDKQKEKWYMGICRLDPEVNGYRYVFFESDEPFKGYKYIGQGSDGCETGGSFVIFGGERLFVCGNDFEKTSNYRIYKKGGMQEATFNFPDGGFRGWGTIIPVIQGSRRRYFWITFDRHNGSDYNWSYGNVYCFEGIEKS